MSPTWSRVIPPVCRVADDDIEMGRTAPTASSRSCWVTRGCSSTVSVPPDVRRPSGRARRAAPQAQAARPRPRGGRRRGRRRRSRACARRPPCRSTPSAAGRRSAGAAAARCGPAGRAAAGPARGRRDRARAGGGRPTRVPRWWPPARGVGVATAARRASSTRVANGGGDTAGSSASTSVTSRTTGGRHGRCRGAVSTSSCTRADAAAASSAATPGAASSTQRASTAAAALRANVALPTPSGPTTSTPRRADPPRLTSSSGRRKVSSSHSTRRRAASMCPTSSSMSRTGTSGSATSSPDTVASEGRSCRCRTATRLRNRLAPRAVGPTGGRRARARGLRAGATRRCCRRGLALLRPRCRMATLRQPPLSVALPTDHRRGHHRHRPGRLGRRDGQQLGRPRAPHRGREATAGRGDVELRRRLDVLRQQRHCVPAGHDLPQQREPRRLRVQRRPRQTRAGQPDPASGVDPGGRDGDRRPVGEARVRQRHVVHRRLPGRRARRRGSGQRGRDAGAGEGHRVPGVQPERVEDLGMQPDYSPAGVTGGGGEPGDQGDGGVEHRATLVNSRFGQSPHLRRAMPSAGTAPSSASPQTQPPAAGVGAAPDGPVRRAPVRPAGARDARGQPRRLVRPEHRPGHCPRSARHPTAQRRTQAEPPGRTGSPGNRPTLPGGHVPRFGVPLRATRTGRSCTAAPAGSRPRSRSSAGTAPRSAARTPARPARACGATSRGGTRAVLSETVGSRLTISPAANSAQSPTVSGADHQPSPSCSHSSSGSPPTSAAAGAGTPTKNSLANG